jgi:high affinity sulfate transporter 1
MTSPPPAGARSVVEEWIPGIAQARHYRRRWLRPDLVAGAVLATILVPQGMAYAELAGVPAVNGLYTTVACLLGYAVFGPSRVLVLGPDSSLGPMIFAAITPLAVAGDPASAVTLAAMTALMVAAIQIALGVGKLGFIADLLSSEVQVGYLNGLAITIIVGQLPKLFGFSTDADGFVDELGAFFDGLGGRNPTTLTVGVCCLVVLFGLPRLTRRVPAVLVVVVGSILAVSLLGLVDDGVATVGVLPEGLPSFQLPWTSWSDVGPLLLASAGITVVSLADTIAASASFAARRGEEVDANREMIGVGVANAASGFFQGFPVSTSSSRTAVAEQSGSRSQLTGLVGASVVAALLLWFNGLLRDLPQAALAAIVIYAAVSLLDLSRLREFFQMRRSSFVLSLTATLGVVLFGVIEGIGIAIVLSILMFFRRNWWPTGERLGKVEATGEWHSLRAKPGAVAPPGMVVYRWEAPLFFANAGIFAAEIRSLARSHGIDWIVLQCEAVNDLDVTAAGMLERLDEELNERGIHLAFVEMRTRLVELLDRYELFSTLEADHFYPDLDEAVAHIEARREARGSGSTPEDHSPG